MEKSIRVHLLVLLWAIVAIVLTIFHYYIVEGGNASNIHKLAVVFWGVQGLIALATFITSFRTGLKKNKITDQSE